MAEDDVALLEPADGAPPAPPAPRLAALGERLAGFIYGTIVVLSVIVAGARGFPHAPGHVAAIVGLTCLVFWLAHVYAHALSHSASAQQRLTLGALVTIARREGSILAAAAPPIVALLLGEAGVLADRTALWLAFVLGVVVLMTQGVAFARLERFGALGTTVVVAANVCLGLTLVALKVFLSH